MGSSVSEDSEGGSDDVVDWEGVERSLDRHRGSGTLPRVSTGTTIYWSVLPGHWDDWHGDEVDDGLRSYTKVYIRTRGRKTPGLLTRS